MAAVVMTEFHHHGYNVGWGCAPAMFLGTNQADTGLQLEGAEELAGTQLRACSLRAFSGLIQAGQD
jgi:hypothetical protein